MKFSSKIEIYFLSLKLYQIDGKQFLYFFSFTPNYLLKKTFTECLKFPNEILATAKAIKTYKGYKYKK
jgi:hypothetical protein